MQSATPAPTRNVTLTDELDGLYWPKSRAAVIKTPASLYVALRTLDRDERL